MPPKKKNAFMLFCEEYCRQNSGDGYNMSIKDATIAAGPIWSKMNDQERLKYRQKAKGTVVKYTTLGDPISDIEKAEEQKRNYERKMFENITSTVHSMAAARSLQYLDVCIFHVNTFCYAENQKRHYPAELAVAKFNLRDGVWDVFHAICNPGPLPLGYAATIQTRADELHQLPVPADPTKSNIEKIFYELISFVDDRRSRGKPPPLYVPPNNYEVAKEFLATLCTDYGHDPLFFEAYSLTHLFFRIRNAAAGEKLVFPTVTVATVEFERDVYEYATGIACSVHEDLGVPNKCSKSIATRMAYIICDNCCHDLNIELIPGKHVAYNAKVASSRASSDVFSTDDEKYRRRKFADSLSEVSEALRFSTVSDDDDSSASSLVSKRKGDRLQFDDTEAEADMSASSLSVLEFESCSVEESDDKFFEPKSSQDSNVTPLNYLSQKTVCDYSSDEDSSGGTSQAVVSKSNKGKGRGRGPANFKKK